MTTKWNHFAFDLTSVKDKFVIAFESKKLEDLSISTSNAFKNNYELPAISGDPQTIKAPEYKNMIGIVQLDKERLAIKQQPHKCKVLKFKPDTQTTKNGEYTKAKKISDYLVSKINVGLPNYELDDSKVGIYYLDQIRSNDDFPKIDTSKLCISLRKVISGEDNKHEVFLDFIDDDGKTVYSSLFIANIPEHYINRSLIDYKIFDKHSLDEVNGRPTFVNSPNAKNYLSGVQYGDYSFVLSGREAEYKRSALLGEDTRSMFENLFSSNRDYPRIHWMKNQSNWHTDRTGVVYYHQNMSNLNFEKNKYAEPIIITENGVETGYTYPDDSIPANGLFEATHVAQGVIVDKVNTEHGSRRRCMIPWNYLHEQRLTDNSIRSEYETFDTSVTVGNQYPLYVKRADLFNRRFPEFLNSQSFRLKNMYDPNWQTNIEHSYDGHERTLNGMRDYRKVGKDQRDIWLSYSYKDVQNVNNFSEFEMLERIYGFYKLSGGALHKSNVYSILIENSGLNERLGRGKHNAETNSTNFNTEIKDRIQQLVEQNIRKLIKKIAPVHTQLWRIIWSGE